MEELQQYENRCCGDIEAVHVVAFIESTTIFPALHEVCRVILFIKNMWLIASVTQIRTSINILGGKLLWVDMPQHL